MNPINSKVLVTEFIDLMITMRKTLVSPLKIPTMDVSPMQFMVLGTVEAHHTLNMTQISNEVAVSNQHLTRLVDGLVTKDYVTRTPDPANRRANLISLTEKGEALLEQHRQHIIEAVLPNLCSIPVETQNKLYDTTIELKKLISEIAKHNSKEE